MLGERAQLDRLGIEAPRELLAPLERAVRHCDARGRLGGEVRGAKLDHLARADEEHALVAQARKDARGEAHRGGRH